MSRWIKEGRTVAPIGTTITYRYVDTMYTIESRKRHIPHANGSGSWDHTTFFVLRDGRKMIEKYSLKDAKEYVEQLFDMTGD